MRVIIVAVRHRILAVWALVDWLSYDPERPMWHRVLYGIVVLGLVAGFIALLVAYAAAYGGAALPQS